ncbi:hypothetical protein [Mesorhizobium denitrificans]|uniref:Uncharacterized protein n=1 Tax=Mesorhizobium denitrificans TaxID=2294114 RepID=A0A371X3L6_9HYPH|nr:hypothetical protein [Mesorhizobium denitrificans]RFC63831.1 hypothetical protein DY251_20660 [Mesorhizobium denitrificans]
MSHDLSLAQNHAWNLARTLMTPVILFKSENDEYGVLPEDNLDGDEVNALYLYDPYIGAQPVQ